MSRITTILCASAALAALALSEAHAQEVAVWDITNAGLTNDCVDAELFSNGNDVTINFNHVLGIELISAPVAMRSCTVTIPVEVADGDYSPEFVQSTMYGVIKDHPSFGHLGVAATFLGQDVSIDLDVPQGDQVAAALLEQNIADLAPFNPTFTSCPFMPDGLPGLYQGTFAVAGVRMGGYLNLFIHGVGMTHRLEVCAGAGTVCPMN